MNNDVFETLSVPKAVAKLALPTVLSQLVTLVYNLADTFFVGHTNDPCQIAALTLSFPIFMTLTMVANLFGIGANSYISRSLGEKKKENARLASTFGFYAGLFGVGIIIAVLLIFMTPILRTIGAVTAETFEYTRSYVLWTVCFGGLPTVGAMTLGHLIRAEGNTKQASIGLALGGLLNIFLDYILVSVCEMGIEGAAIATFISNLASFGYLLFIAVSTRESIIVLNPLKLRFKGIMVRSVILVGIPAAAVIVLGNTANIIMTNSMSSYGDVSIAAQGVVQKIGSVGIQITIGLTQGIMPLLGYCYGAKNLRRFRSVSSLSFAVLSVYAGLCILSVELFADPIIHIFTSESQTVEKGIYFLRIWFLCVPGMCFTNLFGAIFQAMGKWVQSLMLSVVRQLVLLVPLLLIYKSVFGETGLICAQPTADTVTLVIGIVMYAVIMKGQKAQIAEKACCN